MDMYLYGASGHAKVIIDILKANHIEIEGLVDDNPEINELLGYPVFHGKEDLSPLIISIGDNKIRQMIAHKLNGDTSVCDSISLCYRAGRIGYHAGSGCSVLWLYRKTLHC